MIWTNGTFTFPLDTFVFNETAVRERVYVDTETVGLTGITSLIQYAVGMGEVHLYEWWLEPVWKTKKLIDWMTGNIVVGFNLVFDIFHLCKIRTILELLPDDFIPITDINRVASVEADARHGNALKFYGLVDLLLVSRKGPYQSLMARKDIRIKKVPTLPVSWNGMTVPLSLAVSNYLENTVNLDGIYFAKKKDKTAPHWGVDDRELDTGAIDPDFQDVVLRFAADGSLKALAEHALGKNNVIRHDEIELPKSYRPHEFGWAPHATAVSSEEEGWAILVEEDNKFKTKYAWPGLVIHHVNHWHTGERAREYATDDILNTRGLDIHFGLTAPDNDSILTGQVAAVRWHGYTYNQEGVRELLKDAEAIVALSPVNINKHNDVRAYLAEVSCPIEYSFIEETTKKAAIEELSNMVSKSEEACTKCLSMGIDDEGGECRRCEGTGFIPAGPVPVARRAQEILKVKIAAKEVELYNKLLKTDRFHTSYKIMGTLSNRMSGADGLNPQGIKREKYVREKFSLAWEGMFLSGGDFDGFELSIAEAEYRDEDFTKFLRGNVKLHAWFGTHLFPGYTHEQVKASDGKSDYCEWGDMYDKSKRCVFGKLYMGNAHTFNRNVGIPMDTAEEAEKAWYREFPFIAESHRAVQEAHQPLRQAIAGKDIKWVEPADFVESFLGFRRYFTLENQIVRALFDLARNLPAEWRKQDGVVVRSAHRGAQKAWGALTSALYGAAFAVAEANVRAAGNHKIQSPGGEITKEIQCAAWELQPVGFTDWRVAPANVHDELLCVTRPDTIVPLAMKIGERVESFRDRVPLIGMKWNLVMENWAEKKGGDNAPNHHITWTKPLNNDIEHVQSLFNQVLETA